MMKKDSMQIKSMYSSGGCSCQAGIIEKKESTLRAVTCKKCGKIFKTNRNTNLCWKCEKQ